VLADEDAPPTRQDRRIAVGLAALQVLALLVSPVYLWFAGGSRTPRTATAISRSGGS
jgi:hypothetical protein